MNYYHFIEKYIQIRNEIIRDKNFLLKLTKSPIHRENAFLINEIGQKIEKNEKLISKAHNRILKAIGSIRKKESCEYLYDRLILCLSNELTAEHLNYSTRNIYRISKNAYASLKDALLAQNPPRKKAQPSYRIFYFNKQAPIKLCA